MISDSQPSRLCVVDNGSEHYPQESGINNLQDKLTFTIDKCSTRTNETLIRHTHCDCNVSIPKIKDRLLLSSPVLVKPRIDMESRSIALSEIFSYQGAFKGLGLSIERNVDAESFRSITGHRLEDARLVVSDKSTHQVLIGLFVHFLPINDYFMMRWAFDDACLSVVHLRMNRWAMEVIMKFKTSYTTCELFKTKVSIAS